jgi:PAS domain S-box-containing protein
MLDYFGKTLEELKTRPLGYSFHPDDRFEVLSRWRRSVETGVPYDHEARLRRADGVYRWFHTRGFPLRDDDGRIIVWYLLQADIDERRRTEALLAGEKLMLERVARGYSLSSVLDELSRLVEDLAQGCLCSILLVDPDGERFCVGSGPSLPPSYNDILHGKTIDPNYGPCSLAVIQQTPIITADLVKDSRWAASPLLPLMAEYGLRSCWAMPILSGDLKALGVFAIYRHEPISPTAFEQELIDRFTRIAGIAIERARADAALNTREAELRRAHYHLTEGQRLSQTGSFIADPVADEHTWSDELYRICDTEPGSKVTFQTFRGMVHGEDLSLYDAGIERALAGHNFDVALRIVTAKGTLKHIRGVGRVVEQIEGRPLFVGAVQDVTASKLAQEAPIAHEAELRRAYEFLAEAQRVSRTGSFITDPLTEQRKWSDELYRMYEVDPASKLTNQVMRDLVHPDDLPSYDAAHERSMKGADYDLVFRIRTASGHIKYLHTIARVVERIEGRPLFIGAIQDVTESKVAEAALNKARAELAHVARVTTLGALTASIAHEVNQPLSGIITNASTCLRMLAADPPNLDGARTTAQRTLRDGNRASEVLQRLRTLFERKESKTEPVDLNDAAREVLTLSQNELQRSHVILHTDFDEGLPAVKGDRVQLQQVILNLVINAADAMREVQDRPRNLLIATARDDAGQVRLSVRDSGVGIDPQCLEKLFDAFYTTKTTGMGVGLSISRSIVESHAGRLWATANDGPGATFSFSIPCRSEPALGTEAAGAHRPDAAAGF